MLAQTVVRTDRNHQEPVGAFFDSFNGSLDGELRKVAILARVGGKTVLIENGERFVIRINEALILILEIAVDGGKLMEHFICSLEFMNAEKATLEVRESNTAAVNLYTIYGFENIAVRKDYYFDPIENAVIMQRPIAKNSDQLDM